MVVQLLIGITVRANVVRDTLAIDTQEARLANAPLKGLPFLVVVAQGTFQVGDTLSVDLPESRLADALIEIIPLFVFVAFVDRCSRALAALFGNALSIDPLVTSLAGAFLVAFAVQQTLVGGAFVLAIASAVGPLLIDVAFVVGGLGTIPPWNTDSVDALETLLAHTLFVARGVRDTVVGSALVLAQRGAFAPHLVGGAILLWGPRTLPFGKTLAIDAFVALLTDAGLVADLGVEAFGGDFTLFQARSSAGHILFIDPRAVAHISTVTS